MRVTPPQVGAVYEGRTKPGYPYSRRLVVEVTDAFVRWEPVGLVAANAKTTVSMSTWQTWVKRLVR